MLIQSHDGFIELLPAIPDEWKDGNFKGLKVRGGAEVSADWQNHQLQSVEILADVDNEFKLKVPVSVSSVYVDERAIEVKEGFVFLLFKKEKKVKLVFE